MQKTTTTEYRISKDFLIQQINKALGTNYQVLTSAISSTSYDPTTGILTITMQPTSTPITNTYDTIAISKSEIAAIATAFTGVNIADTQIKDIQEDADASYLKILI